MHAKFEGQSLKYAWLDLVVGDFGEDGLGIHIQGNMTDLVVFCFSGRSPSFLLKKGLNNHASPPNKAECSSPRVARLVHSLPCSCTGVNSVCDEVGA